VLFLCSFCRWDCSERLSGCKLSQLPPLPSEVAPCYFVGRQAAGIRLANLPGRVYSCLVALANRRRRNRLCFIVGKTWLSRSKLQRAICDQKRRSSPRKLSCPLAPRGREFKISSLLSGLNKTPRLAMVAVVSKRNVIAVFISDRPCLTNGITSTVGGCVV